MYLQIISMRVDDERKGWSFLAIKIQGKSRGGGGGGGGGPHGDPGSETPLPHYEEEGEREDGRG